MGTTQPLAEPQDSGRGKEEALGEGWARLRHLLGWGWGHWAGRASQVDMGKGRGRERAPDAINTCLSPGAPKWATWVLQAGC